MLSTEGFQLTVILLDETAVALTLPGTDGADVSDGCPFEMNEVSTTTSSIARSKARVPELSAIWSRPTATVPKLSVLLSSGTFTPSSQVSIWPDRPLMT